MVQNYLIPSSPVSISESRRITLTDESGSNPSVFGVKRGFKIWLKTYTVYFRTFSRTETHAYHMTSGLDFKLSVLTWICSARIPSQKVGCTVQDGEFLKVTCDRVRFLLHVSS